MWLRASNKRGLALPFAYVRRALAAEWHVPPWVVDEAPAQEVALALRLMGAEGAAAEWRERRPRVRRG